MDRIPALRRVILAEATALRAAAWSAAAVIVPTALRWAIDRGEAGMPFVTYYPAVVLAALMLGWRWAVGVAVVSAVVANRLFLPEGLRALENPQTAELTALYALSCGVLIAIGEMCRRLLRQLEEVQAREALLNEELLHRMKNMLATVNALATLTARHSRAEEFPTVLSGRMRALLRATELLGVGGDAHCDMHRLVDNALAPFRAAGNFAAEGPACELPRDACVPLSLALHELCTNASKYGALTTPEGRVSLEWTIEAGDEGGEGRMLRLVWREEGGPPIEGPPQRAGMGTQLLRRQRGLSRVDVAFNREGLRCEIRIAGVMAAEAGDERAG